MKRLQKNIKFSEWPQNNTMVKPENHIIYGPCPFYFYCADNWPRNESEEFENWMDPDENYIGKNSKKHLVKKLPQSQQHIWYTPYWWGNWGYDNYYGYSDYGATDSSSDTSGGEWSGSDIGMGGDFGGCEGSKKRLQKISDTRDIHDVPQSQTEQIFNELLQTLLKEGFEWFDNDERGCFGCFGYQLPPIGVQHPIIYLLEECYLMKTGKKEVVVVEHKYDTDGKISKSTYQKFPGELWVTIRDKIKQNGYKLNDGNTFMYTNKLTYQDTKDFVDNEIEKRDKYLID